MSYSEDKHSLEGDETHLLFGEGDPYPKNRFNKDSLIHETFDDDKQENKPIKIKDRKDKDAWFDSL